MPLIRQLNKIAFLSFYHQKFITGTNFSDRAYLRITEQEFVGLPIDILIQGIVSLFVTMYGILTLAGEFKEIRSTVDLESKTWETFRNCPSFYTFNHRGRALSPYYDPPLD
ncbi:hypothetical protein FOCC_FOCC009389 [Frankliniella occidentalis]|nr:hypothetical protein FOCC_FOCC009389 [Frankliniella occidentalis]